MELDRFFDTLADVPNLRAASFEDIEIKDGGNVFLFDGYAAVYNQTADLGEFSEEVAAGAFRSVLQDGPNVPMLHEHHPHQLLATTRSGRLRLEDDERGLRVRAKLVKTDLSARVKALVDSGDITGMSYGFVAGRGNQKIEARNGRPHRLLTGFKKLLDVSTTWNPAFPTTEAQFRAKAMEFADSPESWQRILMGAYPQLGDQGDDAEGTGEETATDDREPPDGAEQPAVKGADSGVAEQRTRSVAARKRALSLYLIEHGDIT